ncbi:hypothetical protein [Roseobacter sp. CCS2]|uniref:hypothetical protein n=1 Tax=Roseobacter sp. CCS2 TaxID=391593 RepID=UPI0000F400DA|nr:hypothetical protein [Roseobacter sp. CCS2]EBA13758.1 hypothetical protein RCCS2_07714 [Roseobacter sp. CCS2]
MVVDELDALRERFEGCTALAFADLSTKMILVTDSNSNLRREALDVLCAEAALLLGANGTPALGEQPSDRAAVASASQLRVFLRSEQEPNDVLCCICLPNLDADAFVTDAAACLDRISGGE